MSDFKVGDWITRREILKIGFIVEPSFNRITDGRAGHLLVFFVDTFFGNEVVSPDQVRKLRTLELLALEGATDSTLEYLRGLRALPQKPTLHQNPPENPSPASKHLNLGWPGAWSA